MSAVLETREPFPPLAGLLAYWRQMKPREKRLTGVAAAFLFLVVMWWLALAPALKTLRQAPDQHRDLDVKIQAMQRLGSEAKALQNQPKLGLEDAQAALQSSVVQRFGGSAQLSLAGERATLTLKNVDPQELAQWLTQARVNARAVPSEVKLNRSVNATAGKVGWDGSLVLSLPRK